MIRSIEKPYILKTQAHLAKQVFLPFLCGLLLLLTACGGEETLTTAVPLTATPQPTDTATAVPPTATPTPTPDITANFETFSDESERVAFQYPPDWELTTKEQTNDALIFILASSADASDLLGAEDFSQPLGFAMGEVRWVAFFGSDDPSLLLADWVEESGLDMSPTGEISLWEQDGVQYASQDFEAADADGDTLLLTAAVIVNGGRYSTFAYGATAVSADEYIALAQAVFDSTVVPYLDPATEPPDQTAALPTRAPQFTGEMALVTNEDGRFQMGVLDMATGVIGNIVDQAANPAWRPGTDELSFTTCDGEHCQIRLTSRENALVSDDEVSFRYGRWSPDGRYLAFTADVGGIIDIYVYDLTVDPPQLTRLTENAGNNVAPIWSPAGSAIIFASDRDGDYDIYLMEANGKNQIPVIRNDVSDFGPALSPDGKKLAYVSDVNGKTELFVFDFAANENRQLTEIGRSSASPTWSPDGDDIAFLTEAGDGQYQLNLIPADGGAPIPYPLLPPGPLFEIAWRPAPQEFAVEIVAVDFADPTSVLRAVFSSARLGDYSQLAGLCDPQGENDGDTAAICEITAGHEYEASFKEWFATGQITGAAVIDGDRAEIPFTFGPEGDQEETMTLIRRDGRWYLLDF